MPGSSIVFSPSQRLSRHAAADRKLLQEQRNMQEYDTLKRLVDEAADDVAKAAGGNKAAGTRVRKKMQEIKSAAQDVRKKILEGRDGSEEAGAGGAGGGEAAGGSDEG